MNKVLCIKCGKERSTSKCLGCTQDFCYNHLTEHRQELSLQFDDIEINRDLFQERISEHISNLKNHILVTQIDQWEDESIKLIQQTARECRNILFQHLNEYINHIEICLTKLTNQILEIRKENDFNEIDLVQIQDKLTLLSNELNEIPNISIQYASTSFIRKISIVASSQELFSPATPDINLNPTWKQQGMTIAGGNGQGNQLNQFSHPKGIYVYDDHQCIYVVDSLNHRIVKWTRDAKNGEIVAGGNGQGNKIDQLKCPTDVIVDKLNDSLIICDGANRRVIRWFRQNKIDQQILISDIDCYGLTMNKNGDLYVSDWKKNEVKRWKVGKKHGTTVAGGNGKGNHLNQLNYPTFIFIDEDLSLYISDWENHRVLKWIKGAKKGIVVAGGQGIGKSLTQLYYPQGLIVDHLGNIYVSDSFNHRIMCWSPGSIEGYIIVGTNGEGEESNQLNVVSGIAFDSQGNLYVVDHWNNRVQKFLLDLQCNQFCYKMDFDE